jgi:site-specific DNA-methyltransferase (adenine-specific)
MATLKGCFLSNTDDWQTPKEIYNYFMSKGYIDPCPYKSEVDNLKIDLGGVNLFINPPYSDIKSWVDYALNHIKKHKENNIVFLIPSRTDTKYFQKMLTENVDMGIYFIKGRLHFNESKNSAPFPSCIIKLEMPKGKKYILEDFKNL